MKKSVALGSGCGGVAVLVYLLFAFTMWDANPGNWETEPRTLCVYITAILCFVVSAFVLVEEMA